MTLFFGYFLSFLIGCTGLMGGVAGYYLLKYAIDPITKPLTNRFPFLKKIVEKLLFLRILLLFAGLITVPVLLRAYFISSRPGLRPYLMDTEITLTFGCLLSPIFLLLASSSFPNKKGFHKSSVRGHETHVVHFSGSYRQTTVSFEGLEVVENPKTGERYGAGPDFEREYRTASDFLEEPQKSGLGKKKLACAQCGEPMDPASALAQTITKKLSFKGMKPFTLKVETPILKCESCGKLHVLDAVELEKAEISACEKGNLCWDPAPEEMKGPVAESRSAGPTTEAKTVYVSYGLALLFASLTFICNDMSGVMVFIFWLFLAVTLFATFLCFHPFSRYDHRGFYIKKLFGPYRFYPWENLREMRSQYSQRKRGIFMPATTLVFADKGLVVLNQMANRGYLGTLRDLVQILDQKKLGERVDSTSRILLKEKPLKGRVLPFALVYFLSFAFIAGSPFAFQTAWTHSQWRSAQALVVDSYRTVDHSSRTTSYYWHLTLEYPLIDGTKATSKITVEGLYLDDWHPGKEAEVLYDPANPEVAVLSSGAVLSPFLLGVGLLGLGFYLFAAARENMNYFHFS